MSDLERIESLKAGTVGAIATGLAAFVLALIVPLFQEKVSWGLTIQLSTLLEGAIALVTGFLFGVSYRYIVRQDDNSHLKSGAILAFGVIRGLAQIDLHVDAIALDQLIDWGSVVMQNIVLFAIAQQVLNLAIAQKWVKPFGN
ncbi:MAG: hypothetical protein SFY66_21275 [Oculatellaceae cyanobacterium bins.114]|nr:hypothetical protein [Oculatellaceae cyanobacterium bins.114]